MRKNVDLFPVLYLQIQIVLLIQIRLRFAKIKCFTTNLSSIDFFANLLHYSNKGKCCICLSQKSANKIFVHTYLLKGRSIKNYMLLLNALLVTSVSEFFYTMNEEKWKCNEAGCENSLSTLCHEIQAWKSCLLHLAFKVFWL